MPYGWIFAYIFGNRRATKIAKIMVIHRHLTFFWSGQFCYLMHLYGKNVQNFKQLLLWSLWANFAQISYGASLGRGNKRLLKWSRFVDPFPHCVLLAPTTDSSKTHTQVSCLRLAFFFFVVFFLFLFLAHLSSAQDELLWSLFVRRPSIRASVR